MTPIGSGDRGARARPRIWRGVVIALAVLPFNAYWASEVMSDIIFSLLVPPLCSLMVLAALNVALRRWVPRYALTRAEMVTVYAFLSVAGAMCSEWMLINHPYVYSYALFGDQSPWDKEHIIPVLPRWFYFVDGKDLDDFRRGGYGLAHTLSQMTIWWRPILSWTVLFGLLGGSMLCINTLMRDQWTRRERLAFPIVQVPVLLTRPESPAWRSGILWGAFAVMFAIDMLNGISFLKPSVPTINVRYLASRLSDPFPWMGDRPWTAIGWTPVGIFPYMAAIGLFMPTDLLFSLVFFFFVRKGLQVGMEMHGYEQGVFGGGSLVPSAPYFSEQTWGAVFALFLGAVASSRGYLRELWGHVRAGTEMAPGELRPRYALMGLVGCLAGLGGIGWACGLSPWIVVAYVGVFLVFSVVLTRMRAQVGPPIHELAFFGPQQLLLGLGGSGVLAESATVKLYHLLFITNRIHRTHAMPYQLEAYKLEEGSGVGARRLFWVMAAAMLVGVAVGQMAYTYHGYVFGAQPAWGEAGTAVRTISEEKHPPNMTAMAAMVAGFGVVMLLDAIRFRFPGFALHPIGYALSMNFGVDYCWFGLLIVLLLKVSVQRYFGLRGYERLRLAAIGVILAEFSAELIWSGIAMATHMVTYSVSFYSRAGWLK